jgi:hypothetical protein
LINMLDVSAQLAITRLSLHYTLANVYNWSPDVDV